VELGDLCSFLPLNQLFANYAPKASKLGLAEHVDTYKYRKKPLFHGLVFFIFYSRS
jgi:hypothetical protein